MSSEENKTTIRRIPEEVFNQGKLAVADEVIAPDFIEHAQLPPDFPGGVGGLKTYVTLLRQAFPDFHYTIEDEIAEGDRVVVRLTGSGTQQGAFLGIPASGKAATWSEIHICRLANGKLVEHWVIQDNLGMLQQLGVIPSPGQ